VDLGVPKQFLDRHQFNALLNVDASQGWRSRVADVGAMVDADRAHRVGIDAIRHTISAATDRLMAGQLPRQRLTHHVRPVYGRPGQAQLGSRRSTRRSLNCGLPQADYAAALNTLRRIEARNRVLQVPHPKRPPKDMVSPRLPDRSPSDSRRGIQRRLPVLRVNICFIAIGRRQEDLR
jgi:hypothetical protein